MVCKVCESESRMAALVQEGLALHVALQSERIKDSAARIEAVSERLQGPQD